jgi:zinc protease
MNVTKAQSMGPIPTDPEVRVGKLDCGLTYYIRHNDYPDNPGKIKKGVYPI